MTDPPLQPALTGLDRAVETALVVLRARMATLAPEAPSTALACAEGIRTLLRARLEGRETPEAIQAGLVRHIFGHADPDLVEALREFAEVINFCLRDARDDLLPKARRRES